MVDVVVVDVVVVETSDTEDIETEGSGVGPGVAGGSGAVMFGRARVVVGDDDAGAAVVVTVVSADIGGIVGSELSLLLVQPAATTANTATPAHADPRRRFGRAALPRNIASR